MTVNFEAKENNKGILTFEIPSETVKQGLDQTYKRVKKNISVPGFRKGKVPRQIFDNVYGEEALYEETLNNLLPDAYQAAVEESGQDIVGQPSIDIQSMDKGKDWVLVAEVDLKPSVTLGEYKGLKADKEDTSVSEEEVNEAIESRRQSLAELVVKEAAAEEGDTVVIDYEGFVDDVAFDGGKAENHSLELGSNTFIPGFEEQLVGQEPGVELDVNVTFPEEYHAEDLAGKDAVFKVKVHEVKAKELPELDDEFAKETSEFDTIADLKADVTKKLEEANAERAEREFEEAVITAVAGNAKVEIPEVMVEKEVDKMVQNLQQRLQYQGLSLEQYFQFTGTDEEKMREYMRTNAQTKVKVDLVLEAIEKAENIEATEEEIKAKAVEVAKMYSASEDEKMVDLLMQSQQAALRADVITNKTMKLLIENNK